MPCLVLSSSSTDFWLLLASFGFVFFYFHKPGQADGSEEEEKPMAAKAGRPSQAGRASQTTIETKTTRRSVTTTSEAKTTTVKRKAVTTKKRSRAVSVKKNKRPRKAVAAAPGNGSPFTMTEKNMLACAELEYNLLSSCSDSDDTNNP